MKEMNVSIEIETNYKSLVTELLDAIEVTQGMTKEVASDVTVRYESTLVREAVGYADVILLTIQFGKDLGYALFAAWLIEKLRNRDARVRIGGKEVPLEKDAIEKTLRDAGTTSAPTVSADGWTYLPLTPALLKGLKVLKYHGKIGKPRMFLETSSGQSFCPQCPQCGSQADIDIALLYITDFVKGSFAGMLYCEKCGIGTGGQGVWPFGNSLG